MVDLEKQALRNLAKYLFQDEMDYAIKVLPISPS